MYSGQFFFIFFAKKNILYNFAPILMVNLLGLTGFDSSVSG